MSGVISLNSSKPGDLEDSMVEKLFERGVTGTNFQLNTRDFFCDAKANSIFSDPRNIASRDAFTNTKSIFYKFKARSSTNIGLSGMLDQAGASPSEFYNYWGQIWTDNKLPLKSTTIVKKGGLCMCTVNKHYNADSLPNPPHLSRNTYFNCDLLLNYYYMKEKEVDNANVLDFALDAMPAIIKLI